MTDHRHEYRRQVLQDLAELDAKSDAPTDFSKHNGAFDLFTADAQDSSDEERIEADELDCLLALSKAAIWINHGEKASQRALQLSPWLSKSQSQDIESSSNLRHNKPSPWELLTFHLTRGSLVMGTRHLRLINEVSQTVIRYMKNCNSILASLSLPEILSSDDDIENCVSAVKVTSSLLGFLKAMTENILFWYEEDEPLTHIIQVMQETFSDRNLELIEGATQMIGASEAKGSLWEWRFYMSNYASMKQPLGSALLLQNYTAFLVSASSALIVSPCRLVDNITLEIKTSTLEILKSGEQLDKTSSRDLSAIIRSITNFATHTIESTGSYLSESVEHQNSFLVSKAHCLHAFINCMILEKEVARPERLLSWLESMMADPDTMKNESLAAVILRSFPVAAKYSSTIISGLSRSLPRFIVQSGISGETVDHAARSLTYLLKLISEDALITGIYTLGNVLTAKSKSDGAPRNDIVPNGGLEAIRLATRQSQLSTAQSTGSVISLNMSDEEEISAAHGNVVRAVICIALSCQDEKIAALAQSVLLQKLGRVGPAIDLLILREAARLALASSINDFKSLLKMYNRIGHDAVKNINHTHISAVSMSLHICSSRD